MFIERTHDAIYAVVLHQYVMERRIRAREDVTELAANHIATSAGALGIRPARNVRVLGFRVEGGVIRPLDQDALWSAIRRVMKAEEMRKVVRLFARIQGKSVTTLERMGSAAMPRRHP